MTYCAVYLIVIHLTYSSLIVYAIIMATAYPLLTVPFTSLTFDTIGKGWQAREMRIEYIVVRELYYNAGRICSVLLFLSAVLFFKNNEDGIRYLMMVIGAGHLAIYFCIRGMTLTKFVKTKMEKKGPNPIRDGESGSPV